MQALSWGWEFCTLSIFAANNTCVVPENIQDTQPLWKFQFCVTDPYPLLQEIPMGSGVDILTYSLHNGKLRNKPTKGSSHSLTISFHYT